MKRVHMYFVEGIWLLLLPPVMCLALTFNLFAQGPAGGAAASALPNGAAAPLPSDQAPAHQAPKLSASAQVQMEAALQKDAFLVFRALCKLSVRASETATGTDMTAIRGKVSCSQSGCSPHSVQPVVKHLQCFNARHS